jgi:hypothetical protein
MQPDMAGPFDAKRQQRLMGLPAPRERGELSTRNTTMRACTGERAYCGLTRAMPARLFRADFVAKVFAGFGEDVSPGAGS